MQFKKGQMIIWGVVALILLLLIPKLKPLVDKMDESSAVSSRQMALPVSVYIVKPEVLRNRIQTTGTILANEQVELKSETSGRIMGIFLQEGQKVAQGELLLKINDSELQANLLKAGYRKKLAEDKAERGRKQLEIEAISQEDYDVIRNEVNTIMAEIQLIKAQIEKTEITAPFDGFVGLRYVSKGSYITQDTRIASLLDLDPIKIDFSVPGKYVNLVHEGDKITFRIQGHDKEYEGEVYAVEPQIDAATRTLQLRARSENPGGTILPGAFAGVRLILEEIADALMIPTEVLIPELNGQKVFVVQGGKANSRNVDIGLRTENRIQVTHGLTAGDTVITSGILQLRPGLNLEVTAIEQ
jgi:membrane fusion protein (multidrug efflux system)